MRFAILGPSLAATLLTTFAHAQSWYADFGAGHATSNGHATPIEASFPSGGEAGTVTSFSFAPLTGSDTSYTARVGARFMPYLAVEAMYAHLGDYSLLAPTPGAVTTFTATAQSGGAAVVGIIPVARLDLYARLGYARTRLKEDTGVGATAIHVDERFNEAYYGGGVRWNVTRELGLFAEYQKHDKLDLDGYFAGMQWRF